MHDLATRSLRHAWADRMLFGRDLVNRGTICFLAFAVAWLPGTGLDFLVIQQSHSIDVMSRPTDRQDLTSSPPRF